MTFYEGEPRKTRSSAIIRADQTFILPDRSCVKSYVNPNWFDKFQVNCHLLSYFIETKKWEHHCNALWFDDLQILLLMYLLVATLQSDISETLTIRPRIKREYPQGWVARMVGDGDWFGWRRLAAFEKSLMNLPVVQEAVQCYSGFYGMHALPGS